MSWNKQWQPRMGGWARLSVKLSAAEEERRQELRLWRAVAMLLIVVTASVATHDFAFSCAPEMALPALGEVSVANGEAVRMPGTPAGIRYYWIVR